MYLHSNLKKLIYFLGAIYNEWDVYFQLRSQSIPLTIVWSGKSVANLKLALPISESGSYQVTDSLSTPTNIPAGTYLSQLLFSVFFILPQSLQYYYYFWYKCRYDLYVIVSDAGSYYKPLALAITNTRVTATLFSFLFFLPLF